MRQVSPLKFAILSSTLLIGAFGLVIASQARAQGYGPPPGYRNGPPEQVEVIAPRFREAPEQRLNGPLEKISLSSAVPYSDLDLATRQGAHELRRRVFETARSVCAELADAYPIYQQNGTHCFREAYENALVRADAAITSARVDYRQSYYDRYGY